MPFTTPEDREKMDKKSGCEFCYSDNIDDVKVGDRCYFYYKQMVEIFKTSRKWTTAHNIYKNVIETNKVQDYSTDTKRAYELAWQVFFQLHVMPYELDKQKENGDI